MRQMFKMNIIDHVIKNFVEPINILNNNAIKNISTMSIMNFNYRVIRNVVGKLVKEVYSRE